MKSEYVTQRELREYLDAALFTGTEDDEDGRGGNPLDANYSTADFSDEARAQAVRDLEAFRFEMDRVLHALSVEERDEVNLDQWAYDFWLTRNGHGVGFWDRPEMYGENVAEALTELAHRAGECDVYVGDDDQVHFG